MIIYNSSKNKLYNAKDMERRRQTTPTAMGDYRDHFEKDYGRIIHSAAFRRLQAKTQIVGLDGGDFHRTRLTHSLEVAQIARGMIIKLNADSDLFHKECLLDVSLIEAAALAHDMGHPPFGHQGEQALHRCMLNYGGFEGNAHTFRILTRLEGDGQYGLNLTRGVLFATIKYPILLDDALSNADVERNFPPKAGGFNSESAAFNWVLESLGSEEADYLKQHAIGPRGYNVTLHKTLESSIIELADDIAYSTHDIEDALFLHMVTSKDLQQLLHPFQNSDIYTGLSTSYDELDQISREHVTDKYKMKRVLTEIISSFISNVELSTTDDSLSIHLRYKVGLPAPLEKLLIGLKRLVAEQVIDSQRIRIAHCRNGHIIEGLFKTIMDCSKLLPENDRSKLSSNYKEGELARIVCDYIAGMTDSYAVKMYQRLFGKK